MLVTSSAPPLETTPKSGELGLREFAACLEGDRRALHEFVHLYERRVFAYLSRALGPRFAVEDLAQEVFVRAYAALGRFDPEGSAQLSTWLLSIAHHVAVDARRRYREHVPILEPECLVGTGGSPEQMLRDEQLKMAVARAVESLPTDQREVFVLAEFHELTVAEIALVTGARAATVKTRIFRARARLRLALGPIFERSQ